MADIVIHRDGYHSKVDTAFQMTQYTTTALAILAAVTAAIVLATIASIYMSAAIGLCSVSASGVAVAFTVVKWSAVAVGSAIGVAIAAKLVRTAIDSCAGFDEKKGYKDH